MRPGSTTLTGALRGRDVPAACGLGRLASVTLVAAVALLMWAHPLAKSKQIAQLTKLDQALTDRVNRGAQDDVRVIVRSAARDAIKQALAAHGDRIEADHDGIQAFTATVHAADVQPLATHPLVDSVSIDAIVQSHQSSANPVLATERVPDVWSAKAGATGAGVRVAVIDSGLEPTADLDMKRIAGFYDFTKGGVSAAPYDDYGHGTHVAGLIAGNGANSNGLYSGVAPSAKILAFKVLDGTGAGYTSNVIQAIDFIITNQKILNINIINLSLGHPIFESAATDPLVAEVNKAVQAGIIVVVAAGNYGKNQSTGLPGYGGITSPGNAPSAITVGAVDIHATVGRGDDTVPVYSSRGPTWYDAYAKPDLAAPGGFAP